jgi:hypothetical protein
MSAPVPSHAISPMTESDVETCGGLHQDSKFKLAINRFMVQGWPNIPFQRSHFTGTS